MTSKQRARLKAIASTLDATTHIGKAGLIPEVTKTVEEALEARQILKISVLKNCAEDPNILASTLAERTRSELVQVIGRKIILYRESKDKKKADLLG